jgi:hypothetical protein
MRTYLAFLVLLALGTACLSGDLQVGATVQVKANSIWFEEAAQLAQWQAVKKRGNAKAVAAYQKKVLRAREAWQFIYQLPVKILSYEPQQKRVHVQMEADGRLAGSEWFLDPDALAQEQP